MDYPSNSPYSTEELDYIVVSNTKTKSREKVKQVAKEKSPSTFTDRIHFVLNKIPFPPSFKAFNGVKVILFLTFLHRIHFYSVHAFISNLSSTRISDSDADDALEDSVETANAFLAFSFMIGPLPGILADKYFGRPKVLSFSFLLCFIGSCMQSLFHSLFELNIHGIFIERQLYYTIHIPVVVILILGSSGIAALLLPYGVDQMEEAGESKMKPYFYWFFWFINLGSLMSFGRYLVYTPQVGVSYNLLSSSYLATVTSFLAVVIFRLSRSFDILHRGPNIGTPLRKILYVTKSSLRIFFYRRTEIDEYENISILDYTKSQHYGRTRFEEVEDVKTFYRIVIVLASLFGYFSLYHLQTHMYILQSEELIRDTNSYISSLIIGLTDSLVVILVLPFVLQFQRSPRLYFLKILYRVELGICLALLSVICANFVSFGIFLREDTGNTCDLTCPPKNTCLMNVLLLAMLPQTILMSSSQILAVVGAYEFVYAQSPGDMKGFTYGILNTVYGLSIYTSAILRSIMQSASNCPQICAGNLTMQCRSCAVATEPCFFYKNNGFIYFLLFAFFGIFYTLYFLFVSLKYKRRERQEIEKWYCN